MQPETACAATAVRFTLDYDDCTMVAMDGATEKALTGRRFLELLAGRGGEGAAARASFTRALTELVRAVGGDGKDVFWECAPFASRTFEQSFKCEVLPARGVLAGRSTDSAAFEMHLVHGAPGNSIAFENLGGDAELVAPVPLDPARQGQYGHLAAFLEGATENEVDSLWRCVGTAALRLQANAGGVPLWLSTHGGGVPWLHVRIDARPKYFSGRWRERVRRREK